MAESEQKCRHCGTIIIQDDAGWWSDSGRYCPARTSSIGPLPHEPAPSPQRDGEVRDEWPLAKIIGAILDEIDMAPNDDPVTYIREYVDGLRERIARLESRNTTEENTMEDTQIKPYQGNTETDLTLTPSGRRWHQLHREYADKATEQFYQEFPDQRPRNTTEET